MYKFKKGDIDYHNDLNDNFKECLVKSDLLNLFYPVGAVFQSFKNTDPTKLFGGTWERVKGKVLVGVDESDSDFTEGKIGGTKTETLTIEQMPAHAHDTHLFRGSNPSGTGGTSGYLWGERAAQTGNRTTSTIGGGKAHNNLQPYRTVYIWERVA